jgi:2-polyprenyl-3-methyl-5-hydroxy-6-metoxy-1,4-benzoquinol methylase
VKAETSLKMGAITEKPIGSKGWDWSLISEDYWNKVSDEFLPVALRWKNLRKKTVLDIGCGRGRNAQDRGRNISRKSK